MRRLAPTKKEIFRELIYNPELITAEQCRRSFYTFLKEFWPEVSNETFKDNWHIQVLCEELTKVAKRVANNLPKEYDLIINIPPGTTKTIICSIMFPVWCWTNWFWMRFITGSYSSPLSLESAEYSRDIVRSIKFRKYFPELMIKIDKDTKSNFRVQKIFPDGTVIFGGNRYSTSTGGTLTGFHGHINVVDDPIDPNQAASEVELKFANRWVSQTLSTRKVDKAVSVMILVMQRLAQNDPTGFILAKKKVNVKHICLPGEIRRFKKAVTPEYIPYYKEGLLDPLRMPWKVLMDMEADLGQYGFAGQVGQSPTPPGGGMFKVDHFQYIDRLPSLVNFVKTVRYWDKAGTDAAGAYTVGVKISLLSNGRWIVEDVKRGQWAAEERERIIRETAETDGYKVKIYFEQEPGSGGKESAEATIRNLAGFSAYSERPVGNKVFRADPYSVQVNLGMIQLLKGNWNHEFVEEHRHFPFSTYKDQVDAAGGAWNKLVKKRVAGPI